MALVTVMFGEETLGSHTVSHYPFVVGRDSSCEVTIDNVGLSRKHCQITWKDGSFHVEDLESLNGTYLNGERVTSAPIRDGDEMKIGKHTLIFHQAPGEEPPPAKGAAGLADMIKEAVEEPASKKPVITDSLKTFQMDAKLIRQQLSAAPPSEPMKAVHVAESVSQKMSEEKATSGTKALLYSLLAVIVVLLTALLVVAAVLLRKG